MGRITVIEPQALQGALKDEWQRIQASNPDLDSPYFLLDYTLAVSEVRRDVFVGVIENHGRVVGFFPFQRGRFGAGRPVGGPMTDFQGAILESDAVLCPRELLRALGLSHWSYDHLPAAQLCFDSFHTRREGSPYADLSQGFDAYRLARQGQGTDIFRETYRKMRKIERDIAPLSFCFESRDPEVFGRIIDWKRAQYARTGAADVLSVGWTVELLRHVLENRSGALRGSMSVLSAGDRNLAIAIGLHSESTYHGWFTVYDPVFAKWSPGTMLVLELMQAAANLGIKRFDLGKGPQQYKHAFMSGEIELAEGVVDTRAAAAAARGAWTLLKSRVKKVMPQRGMSGPIRVLRRLRDRAALR